MSNMMPSQAEIGAIKQMKNNVFGGSNSALKLKKGDYIPEIFFIGQIIGGSDFNVNQDGLFVEAYLNYGQDWSLFEDDNLSGPI